MVPDRPATRVRKSRVRGCLWQAATVVLLVGILAAMAAVADAVHLPPALEKALGRFLLFGVVLTLAYVFLRASRRHTAPGAEEVLAKDTRPPVLYLRCFAADEISRQLFGRTTEEEQLAAVLGHLGPVVAIGRPGERLPELGAARLYVSDADWKREVRHLMDRSRLVVLRLGTTDAFLWEIEQVLSRRRPENLLFLVPTTPGAYEACSRVVKRCLGKELPPLRARPERIGTLDALVVFDPDWTPRLLPVRRGFWRTRVTCPLEAPLQLSLRPVAERLGMPWTPPPLNLVRVLVFGTLAVWAVGMALLGVAALNGWVDL